MFSRTRRGQTDIEYLSQEFQWQAATPPQFQKGAVTPSHIDVALDRSKAIAEILPA